MPKDKHTVRLVYVDDKSSLCCWCSRCGAIYHPKRKKNGEFTKRYYWHKPHRTGNESCLKEST